MIWGKTTPGLEYSHCITVLEIFTVKNSDPLSQTGSYKYLCFQSRHFYLEVSLTGTFSRCLSQVLLPRLLFGGNGGSGWRDPENTFLPLKLNTKNFPTLRPSTSLLPNSILWTSGTQNHRRLCSELLHSPLAVLSSMRKSFLLSLTLVTSVQLLSHVRLSATPWTAACQASLSITGSRSLLKLMSLESVMPSNHLILCHPLLLPPSVIPSIRISSNESRALLIQLQ